jgi:hypothetical protein
MTKDFPITAIYTDIGRGHPNYLDSVLRYLRANHQSEYRKIEIKSIFDISSGLSLAAWSAVRWMYRSGSRGGLISDIYTRLRSSKAEFDAESYLIKILQRDLLKYLGNYNGTCLVAHPLLANMLRGRHRTFYLHGEIAAPAESAVIGAERIYVPLHETAEKMTDLGVNSESLVTTGLVLEPEIAVDLDSHVTARINRIENAETRLTVGFFISGAYPKRHVELMIAGARSCLKAGHRIRFFWGTNRNQVARLTSKLKRFAADVITDSGIGALPPDKSAIIVTASSREDETIRCTCYLPHLDVYCAAPHERVNWAVGAGLPMIAIAPPIGTFAPENLEIVLKSKCGIALSERHQFDKLGETINSHRASGDLASMVNGCRSVTSIHGARVIAEDLIREMQVDALEPRE